MKSKILLTAVASSFLLGGCTNVNYTNTFDPSTELIKECKPVPSPDKKKKQMTMGDLVLLDLRTVEQYKKCAARHKGLVRSYKEYRKKTDKAENKADQ